MRRGLAIFAVVLMLAVAVFIRSRVQDNKQAAADEKAKATMYCVEELRPVCDEIAKSDRNLTVVPEQANKTLERVTASNFNPSDPKIDGWLAPQPFIDMANESRTRAGLSPLFSDTSRTLARSPVVLVGWSDVLKNLGPKCGGQVTWRCVGDLTGRDEVRPVLPSPTKSATGQLVAANAAASYLGNSTFASNDFADPAFRDWLGYLARASESVTLSKPTPLDHLLFLGRASMDLTGALEAQAGPSVMTSRDKDRLTILYPSPLATADVVLAPISGSEPGGRLKDVLESESSARAFAQNGWRVNGHPPAAGLKSDLQLPDGSGLPRAGVLQALASTWQGAGR